MALETARAPIDVIEPQTLRQALAAFRHVESKARRQPSPLTRLQLVERRLREMGVTASDENRQWALAGVLADIVTQRLAALRRRSSAAPSRASTFRSHLDVGDEPSAAGELSRVAEDFQAGDHVRECWSTLHSRFIAPTNLAMDDVARVAGVGRVTLARRLNAGLELLATELRRREIESRRTTGSAAVPPGLRVRVRPEPAPVRADRTAPLAEQVLDALRAEGHPGVDLSLAEAEALTVATPADVTAYRLARVAEWSQPRYALDRRFVRLTLVVDEGEDRASGRWHTRGAYDDLAQALTAAASPLVVLLGAPGAGKSSLLRRFELDEAVAGLRGETDGVTFFVPLGQYRPSAAGALPPPLPWLEGRWSERYPQLPSLADFHEVGQLTLLLDGLNEMPHAGAAAYHELVTAWKRALLPLVAKPGNRVLVSCRGLDYSAPLSSAELRVPQLQVEPLSDDQVRSFLWAHRPALADQIWAHLAGSSYLALARSPYVLQLLVDQVGPAGDLPGGYAALFTGLVRQSLQREIERDHPALRPGPLLEQRDVRQVTHWRWRSPHELPERGRLFPGLAELAWAMQHQGLGGGGAQVRLDRPTAEEWMGSPAVPEGAGSAAVPEGAGSAAAPEGAGSAAAPDRTGSLAAPDRTGSAAAEGLLQAGLALGVLDEDVASDEVVFRHQLLQEYFAARRLARAPEVERVRQPWRAHEMTPPLPRLLAELPAGEPLPPLPATGWEETARLAAAMSADPADFVAGVAAVNLALAGDCAARPDVKGRLEADGIQQLRQALVNRSRDPAADLRARIAAGRALGDLGDPRFERHAGPDGTYLLPPMVLLPAGEYVLGRREPFEALGRQWWARYGPHILRLPAFELGRFPVTNAEWACFQNGGGYEDERWWDTPAAAAWRRGEGTTAGIHASVFEWVERYRADPELLAATHREGAFSEEVYERWRRRVAMTPAELGRHVAELYPPVRHTQPRLWTNSRFNHPAQPVVAISWYEARAYGRWLSAQTGRPFRLPTDAELEAAARGSTGREYPWGGPFDPLRLNCVFSHILTTTPVGVYPEGDSPEGITDLSGNVETWTSTLVGSDGVEGGPTLARWQAGLEVADAPAAAARVVRGGSWMDNHSRVHPTYAASFGPDYCPETVGLRLACDVGDDV